MENFKEEWRPIPNYEELYIISNYGKIKRIERIDSNGRIRKIKLLKHKINKCGYCSIGLTKNGKRKFYLVHRLVAETFIQNINNYQQINHKDENKQNNRVDNLEWCDCKYNINYGNSIKKRSNGVIQLTLDREFIKEYVSGFDASKKNNIARTNLYNALNGNTDSAGGFIWEYVDVEKRKKSEERRKKRATYNKKNKIIQYSIDGIKLNEFESLSKAAKHIGVSIVAIRKNCTEETKFCKGYIFKYKEDSL